MIVLVRCNDDTYSVAMESRIEELGKTGLIKAYLRDGEWEKITSDIQFSRNCPERRRPVQITVAAAA